MLLNDIIINYDTVVKRFENLCFEINNKIPFDELM